MSLHTEADTCEFKAIECISECMSDSFLPYSSFCPCPPQTTAIARTFRKYLEVDQVCVCVCACVRVCVEEGERCVWKKVNCVFERRE